MFELLCEGLAFPCFQSFAKLTAAQFAHMTVILKWSHPFVFNSFQKHKKHFCPKNVFPMALLSFIICCHIPIIHSFCFLCTNVNHTPFYLCQRLYCGPGVKRCFPRVCREIWNWSEVGCTLCWRATVSADQTWYEGTSVGETEGGSRGQPAIWWLNPEREREREGRSCKTSLRDVR